jgi:hypothetical protein
MSIEREITSEDRHLQILQKTAELISVETPDLSPVGNDRAVKILTLHREIRELMVGNFKEIGELVEVENR